jgi:glycosyltransferase involved in cell wall biosynthesis
MDFISLSLNHWEDLWQSRHQIMGAIAREHKVLFVSPPFSFSDILDQRKKSLPRSGLVHRDENLYTLVFSKWLFETYGHPRLERIMRYLRNVQIRRAAARLGLRNPVLFIWHPYFAHMQGQFGEVLTCYYVDDEFAGYESQSEEERQKIRELEERLLRSADCVFANGPALAKSKDRRGNVINVPMCADFSLFSKSRLPETRVPSDLESISHPRVGYIGNINDKVDFQLLYELAINRPSWSFVLVGPVHVQAAEKREMLRRLQEVSNVSFLGVKPRESLPSYIKGLDVCLLCYRRDNWARYVYPLKLHEYLASGKPVVGTPLESLKQFDGTIRIAGSPAEWLASIEAALREHDENLAARRVQVAYENRLEKRVEIILDCIGSKQHHSLSEPKSKIPRSSS